MDDNGTVNMDLRDEERLSEVERKLDYRFRDRALLEEALTHRTYVNEAGGGKDNQRLEFFGDSVLDFLLSDMLLVRFPESREGELTRIRASLVDEASLAKIALGLDLGSGPRGSRACAGLWNQDPPRRPAPAGPGPSRSARRRPQGGEEAAGGGTEPFRPVPGLYQGPLRFAGGAGKPPPPWSAGDPPVGSLRRS